MNKLRDLVLNTGSFFLAPFSFSQGESLGWEFSRLVGYAFFLILAQSLFGLYFHGLPFDFLGPFLVYRIIVDEEFHSLSLVLLLALVMESGSFFPFGFYLSSYVCVWLFVTSLRPFVCWENLSTWFSCLLISEAWLCVMEFFLSFKEALPLEAWSYFLLFSSLRILVALGAFSVLGLRRQLVLSRETLL